MTKPFFDSAVKAGIKISFLLMSLLAAIALVCSSVFAQFPAAYSIYRQLRPYLVEPHHHCPFCGMTHSFMVMAKGDWTAAYRYNHLGPFFFFGFGICLIVAAAIVIGDLKRRSKK